MTNTIPISDWNPRNRRHAAGVFALLMLCTGCITPWERSALLDDKRAEIGSVQGPTERRLLGLRRDKRLKEPEEGDSLLQPIAGADDFHDAEELFNDEKYSEAEKAFKKVAKKYKKSEIREDALFMEAEAAFAQERYAKAHDLYARVLKDFPTTRHLDKISSRMFKIAMIWLDHPQVADMDQIQQVNHEKYGQRLPPKDSAKQPSRMVFIPNFTNKTRPVFDPQGNAVAALRSIWTNDPTGPLADDALMLAASYYSRAGEFVEADRHFTMLREQFPNSPHVQKAFELGSHVKLMSYQGAPYDGKSLQDSEQLKLATLRLYPDLENRDRMQSELGKIEEAKADRLWAMVVFYERKGRRKAVAIYCHLLLSEHPKSPRAAQARKKLEQLGPAYADGRALKNPYPDPPQTLMTAIFPPDDHGGVPVPPSAASGSVPPTRYGARFALIKPKQPQPPVKNVPSRTEDAEDEETELAQPARRPAIVRPRQLDEDDAEAEPAPVGRSRLGDEPRQVSDESEDEDDNESGHTRL